MAGQKIGNYEIVEEIGRGAMGQVYRVRSSNVPRDFALKLITIPGGDEGEESLERVKAEVMAMAKFHHPHIVGLIDAFTVPGRRIAIVMEYLEGRPLGAVRDDMTVPQFMLVFRQIASALAEVHDKNVIHRDIKPSNILVSWKLSDVEPHSYLIDFGITSGVKKSADLTTGFIGSPAFASPEQVAGESVTAATDRFSLGAVAFDAITGVAPFEAETVVASLHKHLDWERPDLSPFYGVEFPAGFCQLVESLLEPNPDDRPSSMREIVDRVDRLLGLSNVLEGSEVVSEASSANESKPVRTSLSSAASEPSVDRGIGDSVSEATIEVASDGEDRVWIDDGVIYLKREIDPEPELVDSGGLKATAAALMPSGLAFAVESDEIHVLDDSGARRIIRVGSPIDALHWDDERDVLIAATRDGEEAFDVG